MTMSSRVGMEDKGMFTSSAFYIIAGVILLAMLFLSGFAPHIALLGFLSLIAGIGLFFKRFWSFYFVLAIFVAGTAFSAVLLFFVFTTNPLTGIAAAAYLVLIWIFTIYVAVKRSKLEG